MEISPEEYILVDPTVIVKLMASQLNPCISSLEFLLLSHTRVHGVFCYLVNRGMTRKHDINIRSYRMRDVLVHELWQASRICHPICEVVFIARELL